MMMDFLKKFFSAAPTAQGKRYYIFKVKCNRCGEVIEGHINLSNDLSLDDNGDSYLVHKTLMGNGKCFQRIEVEMNFNASKQLIEKQAQGGTFVD
jgi:hypothetical protein